MQTKQGGTQADAGGRVATEQTMYTKRKYTRDVLLSNVDINKLTYSMMGKYKTGTVFYVLVLKESNKT